MARLKTLHADTDKAAATAAGTLASGGSCIEFENVTVQTPTGVELVRNLSFSLKPGGSLLLTGHNGAGKSSIFRCLGGLWKIPSGKITKPGGAASGLHQDVFYLPQKPYNVLGTLVEQLTYPQTGATLPHAQLLEILQTVELAYLARREGVLEREVNWEETLSFGEKQRLAIARLLYHKPKYAILDECTSGVSSAMERKLYACCMAMSITFITICAPPPLHPLLPPTVSQSSEPPEPEAEQTR